MPTSLNLQKKSFDIEVILNTGHIFESNFVRNKADSNGLGILGQISKKMIMDYENRMK